MDYWQGSSLWTALTLVALLFVCELLARLFPSLRRLAIPLSIIAGLVGLLGSQQVLGLFELDASVMESAVYHGVGLLFIAIGLRTPSERRGSGRNMPALSMGFAIPTIFALQALVALLALMLINSSWHAGFAMFIPAGFEEGPGQALSLGAAWEETGLEDGPQIGLIIAAIGYGWAILAGVPLALIGRRRGWLSAANTGENAEATRSEVPPSLPGGLDHLSVQIALVGLCYVLTYWLCRLITLPLAGDPDIAGVIWGFHFIWGSVIAISVRALLARVPGGSPINNELMTRVGGLGVDLVTCAALAAIQLAVLRTYWLPIVVLTSVGGVVTVLFCIWIGSRAWVDAPLEHTLLWFGMSTGTLPTGLALLRIIDPDLRTPAASSVVLGSALAAPLAAPLLLVFLPMTVRGYVQDWPSQGWLMVGLFAAYFVGLLVLWRLLGGLRFRRPLNALWFQSEPGDPVE